MKMRIVVCKHPGYAEEWVGSGTLSENKGKHVCHIDVKKLTCTECGAEKLIAKLGAITCESRWLGEGAKSS